MRVVAGKLQFASVSFLSPGERDLLGAEGAQSFTGLCLELDLVGLQVAICVLKCPVSVVSIGFGDGEP